MTTIHAPSSARQQLSSTWLTVPEATRESSEGEATAGGIQSYVDLLTCLQDAVWASAPAVPLKVKGAPVHEALNQLERRIVDGDPQQQRRVQER